MTRRFSIVVPVYNRAKLVRETIDSVLSQSFTDYELVLINDGSKDNSLEILRSYGDRVKVLDQANQGAEAARYQGFAATSGEYVVLLDDDDILMPNALATYDRIIRTLNAPPVIIGAVVEFHSKEDLPTGHSPNTPVEVLQYETLFTRARPVAFTCSQIVVQRSAAVESGAIRTKPTAWPYETADIQLALSTHGPWVAIQQPTTIAYRRHASNTIGNLALMLRTAPCLIGMEKQGAYPGGRTHRFARRAYIGGVLWNWCRQGLTARQFLSVARLMIQGAPMITRGILRKLTRKFQPMQQSSRLPEAADSSRRATAADPLHWS